MADWQTKLLNEYIARSNDVVLITENEPLDAPHGPRIVFANEAVERVTGYSVEEVIGQTPRMFQGRDTDRQELDRIRAALEKEQPVHAEVLNYTKSGTPIWLEVNISPVSADHGEITHYLAIQRDITARKQAQLDREKADERFHLITGATKDVIWDWNIERDEVWRSESYQRQYGHAAGLVSVGKSSWTQHVEDEDRNRVLASLRAFLNSAEHLWSAEYRFRDKEGRLHWVSDRAMAERDRTGKAHRLIGVVEDITHRKMLEERLSQAERLDSLGKLTGGIAHDFNNLLTVVLGNSERLAEQLPEGRHKEMAELSLSACESASALVSRLLAFARRQPLVPKPVNLNERLGDTAILVSRTLPETIAVRFVDAPKTHAAQVDSAQFDTAVLNLCLNARDAMPDGGEITLDLQDVVLDAAYTERDGELQPGAYVMVTVTDTGTGMSPETVERAFEPFYTTKEHGAGTGLGLSMVYGFVKQSGGHVAIYSEEGIGTSVKMFFPQAERDAEENAEDEPCADTGLPPLKLLVVEDNQFVLAYAERLLGELGMDVHAVSTADEAMDVLEGDRPFDLLFTDIVLPGGLDGVQLAERARQTRPGLPVLFTTGYTTNSILVRERLDPSVSVLTKPYRKAALIEKIREVLDHQKQTRG